MSKKFKLPAEYTPSLVNVFKEGYTKQLFINDLLSGLIVGVVALPLAIAFAIASGVSPAQGIITAIFAGFVTAILGGSRTQVSGPTGAFIVILYGIVQKHGVDGLATATLLAGVLLILMGLARFGGVLKFIPFPVIVGFTSGIAVIIATGQIPAFLGLKLPEDPAAWVDKIVVYATHITTIQPWTILIGLISLFLVIYWGKMTASVKGLNKIPGSLIAIIVGTVLVKVAGLPVVTIGDKFGAVPSSIPAPRLPAVSLQLIRDMFQPAITIAMLAGIESLLSAVVADGMTGQKHKSNMELVAHGVANIVSPIFGGIPSTGAIARTATNIRNGGRTPVSAIVHSATLLIIMLFFGKLASLIPMATLAAILLMVAYNMSEWQTFIKIFKAPRSDIAVLITTFLLTVIVDLTVAIQVGVVLAAMLFIKRMAEVSKVDILGSIKTDEESAYDPMGIAERTIPDGVVVYEIYGQFFFGAVDKFKSILNDFDKPAKVLIIRMRSVLTIDSSGLIFVEDLLKRCEKENVRLILSGVHTQPTLTLAKAGLLEQIGEKNFAAHIDQALEIANEHIAVKTPENDDANSLHI